MKKSICFLIIFMSFSLIVNAEEKTTFYVDEIKASAGENVTVSVNMKNNPKFELLGIKLNYDMKKMTYDSCEIKGFTKAMMKSCEPDNEGNVVFYALTVYEDEEKLMDDTGNIFNVKFKINESAEENIPLKLEVTDYGKTAKSKLDYTLKNAVIKLKEDIVSQNVGETINLKKKISTTYKNKKIIWKSSDESVAVVDEDGNVTFKKEGNVTITAQTKDNDVILKKRV